MLRLSTKGRYGVRALLELAGHPAGEPVLMSTIAERQAISRKYLHALLTTLRSSGLVRSVRGAQGGYTLGRPADQIRLDEVVESLEGPLALTDCVLDQRACDRSCHCAAREVWEQLSAQFRQQLTRITLQDLFERQTLLDRVGPGAPQVQP